MEEDEILTHMQVVLLSLNSNALNLTCQIINFSSKIGKYLLKKTANELK